MSESKLQSEIVKYLHDAGVLVLYFRTDKRNTAVPGWPDLTFCIYGHPIAFELKADKGRLSDVQKEVGRELVNYRNRWDYHVIWNLESAKMIINTYLDFVE